jgi:hypothetical protein
MLLLRCFAAGVTAAVGLGTQGRPCSSTQTAVGTHCSDSTDPIRMCCVKPQVAVTQCFGAVVQQAYKTQKRSSNSSSDLASLPEHRARLGTAINTLTQCGLMAIFASAALPVQCLSAWPTRGQETRPVT